MAQPDRNIDIEKLPVSPHLVDLITDVSNALGRKGVDCKKFIDEIDHRITQLKEDIAKATIAFGIKDPKFNVLSEAQQRTVMYQTDDEFYGRQYNVWLRDLDLEAKAGNTAALGIYNNLFETVGAYRDEEDVSRVNVPLSSPSRKQYFEVPMSCPFPPLFGGFFETPVSVRNDSLSDEEFVLNAIKGFAGDTEARNKAYPKRVLTPRDLLANSIAQASVATRIGVLEEGELWENFLHREDMQLAGPDDQQKFRELEKAAPHSVIGMQGGIQAMFGHKGEVYFGGLPTFCQTPTKYPGIEASVQFIADRGDIHNDRDRTIPLDLLIRAGKATPRIALHIPTDYLVPIS